MDPENACPDLIPGGGRLSRKDPLNEMLETLRYLRRLATATWRARALAAASRAISCRTSCESCLAGSVSRADFIVDALQRKLIVHCCGAGNAR
jgi:hypothetical protein